MSVSASNRGFKVEINTFISKKVLVQTKDGETYKGVLKGIDENLNIVLSSAETDTKSFFRIILLGHEIRYISLTDVPFDLPGLAQELSKVFKPENVRLHEDQGVIMVMDRFKVNEEETTGSGPVAERIRAIWSDFKSRQP